VDRLDAIAEAPRPPIIAAPSTKRAVTWTLRGASVAFLATSTVFGILAWRAHSDFEDTRLQRPASEANDRFKLDLTLAVGFAASGAACAAVSYLTGRGH